MYIKESVGALAMAAGFMGTLHYADNIYSDLQNPLPSEIVTAAQFQAELEDDVVDIYKATGSMVLMAAGTALSAWASGGRLKSITAQAEQASGQYRHYGT